MKKFCTILGLSLFLTGCFDQPKVEGEKAETATTAEATTSSEQSSTQAVENTETSVTAAEKGEASSAEASTEKASDASSSEAEKSAAAALKSSDEQNAVKTDEAETSSAEKGQVASELQAGKNSQNFSKTSNVEPKPKAHKEAAKTVHKKKGFDYNSDQLSPEEKRLGITEAVIVTEQDIQQMKYKCRYPLMNEQELETYNCPVKPVTISN